MNRVRLAAALLFFSAALITSVRAAEPIEIIAPFNLTGDSSVLDGSCYNGAALAAEIINQNGGLLGRTVDLIPVDTESKPDIVASKVVAALAAHPKAIAGIGFSYSTEALDAGRVFQAAGLPFISPGATDPAVPVEVGDDMFYAAYGDDAQAAAMAAFARNELKADRAAVWVDNGRLYPQTIGRFFKQSFEQLGGTVDLVETDPDPKGFAGFITRYQATSPKPQVVYVASMPDSGPALIKEARAAGIDVPLMSGDGWDEDTIVEASKNGNLSDIYFTTHRFIGVDTPAMMAFVDAYKAKYGHAPSNAFAALGYDTVNLIADAVRRAGSTDPGAVRDVLAATTGFDGVVGKISYAPGKRVPIKAVAVIAVDDGIESLRWVTPLQ